MVFATRHSSNASTSLWGFLRLLFTAALTAGVFLFSSGCGDRDKLGEAGEGGDAAAVEEVDPLQAILEDPDFFKPEEEPVLVAEEPAFVHNKANQVSILCYHDFNDKQSGTQMIMPIHRFREQMAAIAEAEIPVVPMEEFLAWRRGEANLPDPCIVITMDDGWKAVHTLALPVLKEFGFPFTCFLYTNYINIGGRSLAMQEVREIQQGGGHIGCHSVSHADLTKGPSGAEAYATFLEKEFATSKQILQDKLGVSTTTFAYPYGKYNEACLEVAEQHGYEALFTVNGRKATFEETPGEIGRFVIHGDNDQNFKFATTFRGRGNIAETELIKPDQDEDEPLVTTYPKPDSTISERSPELRVELAKLGAIDPASLQMRLAGFGVLPIHYDSQTGVVTAQLNQKLRSAHYTVQVVAKPIGADKSVTIPWRFHVDLDALYLGGEETAGEGDAPVVSEGR